MQAEIQLKFNEVNYALDILKKHIDWDNSLKQLEEFNNLIEKSTFWDDSTKAQLIMRDKKNLEKTIEVVKSIENEKNTLIELQ